jgi:hypothetical protein
MSSVRDIVETIGKDHLGQVLIEIDEMLISYEIFDHHSAIDLLEGSVDELDSGEIFMMLSQFLKSQMLDTLSELKLTFADDVDDLKKLKEIFVFIFEFDQLENLSDYVAIMDNDGFAEDIFFDMLELHYGTPAIEYSMVITNVRNSLITDLKEQAISNIDITESLDDVVIREKARMFFLKEEPIRFKHLIDEGFSLGFSLSTYISELFKDVDLDDRSPSLVKSYAKDIAMAVLSSKEGRSEAIEILEEITAPFLPTDMIFNQDVFNAVKTYVYGVDV